MNISEYVFVDPGATPAGRSLAALARRPGGRGNRLIAALEAFALENTVYADRVAPRRWCGSITAGALSSWWR